MFTFYYTYSKLLDNTIATIPRGAKSNDYPKTKNVKTRNSKLKLQDMLLDSVSRSMSDQCSDEEFGKSRAGNSSLILDEKGFDIYYGTEFKKEETRKIYVKILDGCFVHSGSLNTSQSNRTVSRMKL